MRQVMVYEMGKLPYDVAIDQPIPCKAGFENSILFKKANTKSHGRYRNEPGNKPIEYINKKDNPVGAPAEFSQQQGTNDFDD